MKEPMLAAKVVVLFAAAAIVEFDGMVMRREFAAIIASMTMTNVISVSKSVWKRMLEFRNFHHSKVKYFSIFCISITLAALIFIINQTTIINVTFDDVPLLNSSLTMSKAKAIAQVPSSSKPEPETSLSVPLHVSKNARIAWLKKNLPKFKIFKSDNLTKHFQDRLSKFFKEEYCEIQFFMTWFSPANSFGIREFLAVETLFNVHPRGCLVIVSRSMDSEHGFRIVKPLIDRSYKVAAVRPDLDFLFRNTPAETWFHEIKTGKKDPGEISLAVSLSDLIRLAVLYKYGGVYLDTDFVTIKSFKGLRNSVGAQSADRSNRWTRLNGAVLVFDKNHPILYEFMEEFASTFDGNKWGQNGPYLVSRVVKKMEGRPGYNVSVLPPKAFYPVSWTKIGDFFKMAANQADSKWVEATLLKLSANTYGVHLWNKLSRGLRIEQGSVMDRLISSHCIICHQTYNS
ncbi:uncharacterized protein [Rutidosis leptorrhynchoides]|uniref:uncharacterized protein n=1 Tax=Rutidosis leptorrhynchoides TaxID=125765 RepID=UPI003A99FA06